MDKVVFIGYWEWPGWLGQKPQPAFNVGEEESTLSEKTLEEKGIKVPPHPTFEEWKKSRSGSGY